MRILFTAIMVALLAGPAYAQDKPIPRYGDVDKDKSPQEKQAERDAEKAYQRSLGNIPAKAGSNDPWGTVRSEPPAKPAAAAPTAKKTKTTSGTATEKPQ
jgi:hypothetical protein